MNEAALVHDAHHPGDGEQQLRTRMPVQPGLMTRQIIIRISHHRPRCLFERLHLGLAVTRQNLARRRHSDTLHCVRIEGNHHDPSRPPDLIHQHRSHDHPL